MIIQVETEANGLRLDSLLKQKFTDKSRQSFQQLIIGGHVKVNNQIVTKPGFKVKTGQEISVFIPPAKSLDLEPLEQPLDILFEDDQIIVINKPAGLVVHPGAGTQYRHNSLVNILLAHSKGNLSNFNGIERPGIVHRLDKDTSGVMVIAKTPQVHEALMKQFQQRTVKKFYIGLVLGKLTPEQGLIEGAIGRDPRNRQKMAVVHEKKGKFAQTSYKVLDYFPSNKQRQQSATLVQFELHTGRTHQIRVHCASIGFPLVGDELYGNHTSNMFFKDHYQLERHFLHAQELTFEYKGKNITCKAPLPEDLERVITMLTAE